MSDNIAINTEFSVSSTPYGLQGKLLVATPHIGDPLFEKSVIYMCLHGEDGAMGVVVNHSHHGLTFTEVLENLSIDANVPPSGRVEFGGAYQLLFNLTADPSEAVNLARSLPEELATLKALLDDASATAVAPVNSTADPLADAACLAANMTFVPWLDDDGDGE